MLGTTASKRFAAGCLAAVLVLAPAVRAESAREKFYRAYYLEKAQGDLAGAAKLYADVAAARGADAALRSRAKARRAVCQEELASEDFARLMPPEPLVYAEFNRPGDQLVKLLDQLGLLAGPDQPVSEVGKRFAISPALIKELLGVRGAALAMTGFDPGRQAPTGVVVLHPGDVEVIRGLIETALPVAAAPAEPIEDYPTFNIEDEVFVTLTARLVIVSQQRSEIENVILRLKDGEEPNLATNSALAEVMRGRKDALFFFCVNVQPVMPLLNAALAAGTTQSRELAVAQALLDLKSLKTLSGRAGVTDAGLDFQIKLQLEEGHRNLVYNFLRRPPVDRATLKRIPAGAAAFLAAALSDAGATYRASATGGTPGAPVVTALDIGREIFANIIGIAVYALPPADAKPPPGPPIPDVAAVITVHDPEKSEALWTQALGIASLVSGGGIMEGTPMKIEGVPTRRFTFPGKVTVYLAIMDNELLVSPSKAALARSIKVGRGGESVLEDAVFAKGLSRLGPSSTVVLFAHPGRCTQIARLFMSRREIEEMEPIAEVLTDTVASLVVDHSDRTFRLSASVTGIPKVGPLVTKLIADQRRGDEVRSQLKRAMRHKDWHTAIETLDEALNVKPDNVDLLWKKFEVLATGLKDHGAALEVGKELLKQAYDDATYLNNKAWDMLTEDRFGDRYAELALDFSQRSNALTDHANWMFVDTLAWARFKTGDVEAAVELEKKALELCRNKGRVHEVKEALARFEEALKERASGDAPAQ